MNAEKKSVDVGRLKILAEKANREHSQAQSAARQRVLHAVAAGTQLCRAKEEVGHGSFGTWLEENFDGTRRTADRYVRLAVAVDEGRINPQGVSSLAEAERLLREQDAEQAPLESELLESDEKCDLGEPSAESEPKEFGPETQRRKLDGELDEHDFEAEKEGDESEPAFSKQPAPSKKKEVDPLRNALNAIGLALGSASDEQRTEWAQILRDEIDLYMGSLDQEEAA